MPRPAWPLSEALALIVSGPVRPRRGRGDRDRRIRVDTIAASTINVATAGNVSAANDLAIETPHGPITINNNGIVTGFVHLASGSDTFNNNASATWFTHSAGTAGSTSVFGPGNDVLSNSGTIVAARRGSIAETVVFNGLADFVNGDPTRA